VALGLTTDQQDLRDSVRDYCTDTQGADVESIWRGIAALGLTEIPFPERFGGAGSTLGDTAVVVSELGRVLSPAPYLTSITAGLFLTAAVTTDPPPALGGLVSGTAVGALVDTAHAPSGRIAVARGRDAGTVVLDGVHDTVLGADRADVLVIAVRRPDGPEVFVVDAHDAGVHITPLPSLDTTRPLSRVELREAGAIAVVGPVEAPQLRHAEAARLALFAAEQVGAAERCVEMSLDYAQRRHQFGRPIGSFQAVKHRLVDMHIEVELARSAVQGALEALDEPATTLEQADLAAHIAGAAASKALTFAATEAIQVHGGIGFTWEFPLHHYFRRAKTTEVLMGAPDHHLTTIAGLAASTPTHDRRPCRAIDA
jgi:alkylation response protein AidB-like acyl-CoA dehydrogenase